MQEQPTASESIRSAYAAYQGGEATFSTSTRITEVL